MQCASPTLPFFTTLPSHTLAPSRPLALGSQGDLTEAWLAVLPSLSPAPPGPKLKKRPPGLLVAGSDAADPALLERRLGEYRRFVMRGAHLFHQRPEEIIQSALNEPAGALFPLVLSLSLSDFFSVGGDSLPRTDELLARRSPTCLAPPFLPSHSPSSSPSLPGLGLPPRGRLSHALWQPPLCRRDRCLGPAREGVPAGRQPAAQQAAESVHAARTRQGQHAVAPVLHGAQHREDCWGRALSEDRRGATPPQCGSIGRSRA